MDVHPPHQPLHTWKDFWIHLGTITIGLLIALGLEATAEWAHRVHERHVLEEELYAETQRNEAYCQETLAVLDDAIEVSRWDMLRAKAALPGQSSLKATIPAKPDGKPRVVGHPDMAVWDNARQNGAVALLPETLAQMYTDNYRDAEDAVQGFWHDFFQRNEDIQAFRSTLPNQPEDKPTEFDRLSKDEIQAYLGVESHFLQGALTARRLWVAYAANNSCLLTKPSTFSELGQCTSDRQKSMQK